MRFAAFFRAMMLGRAGQPTRLQLLAALEAAGADEPVSFQAHGNAVFSAAGIADARHIIAIACERLTPICGWNDIACVRSLAALRRLLNTQPFADAPATGIHEYCVTFLPPRLRTDAIETFAGARGDFEILHASDSEVFSITRLVGGRPGNVTGHLERQLGHALTTRNWNTVRRLLERHG